MDLKEVTGQGRRQKTDRQTDSSIDGSVIQTFNTPSSLPHNLDLTLTHHPSLIGTPVIVATSVAYGS
ncbi:hypothetical protein CH63R_12207 [Colletotrichum higginsianum IMI 349063]|uniref:Uncharacterized protein n=1 Tax=Colletotrichum higginsianum (strain IMI 349063) TaxID=759273 RepID=A0A1B7Y0G2_COLHI|nr:hypothetical protein CH63R_12207 [Colletotrichum higginsianum IMI 349063]OBR05504.1 hypothetical protein CH63R_12207 [Colletotrichum higginsianum IMI 349063]